VIPVEGSVVQFKSVPTVFSIVLKASSEFAPVLPPFPEFFRYDPVGPALFAQKYLNLKSPVT